MAAPSSAGDVRVRAVRVRPEVVRSIVPRDVNIVLERLEALRENDRFDVIVATNILVYYDAFEQALALANVSKMLRPGGFFLTNYAVAPSAPMESTASLVTTVDFDRQHNGDTLFWYQRR
jgi:chemotaxis methyl-accepting protein methylase